MSCNNEIIFSLVLSAADFHFFLNNNNDRRKSCVFVITARSFSPAAYLVNRLAARKGEHECNCKVINYRASYALLMA